jgi:Protein of unknown function (DUF2934)
MVKKASSNGVKTPSGNAKSSTKKSPAASAERSSASLDERLIRERAYGIWLEEGRPHGRDLAHWQRAHQELQQEVQ